jgi:two-component system phosphate regulon response regulator PhoB
MSHTLAMTKVMTGLILIVEDERDLASTLEYNFQREGYETRVAHAGKDALDIALKERPALVLLDLMLPDMSGIEVCRRLKQSDELRGVPVMMVTARGEEIDRVVGFEVGADDYIVKPFSVRELLLRVQAVLRRTGATTSSGMGVAVTTDAASGTGAAGGAGAQTFGRLFVDDAAHRVRVDGNEVVLTALEFRLLWTLLQRKGRVQSRDTLLNDVWGISADVTTRTVDTHVKRLREKLGPLAGAYVETLRGVGYRFAQRPEDAQGASGGGGAASATGDPE